MNNQILDELKEITKLLRLQKQILTLKEFCTYTGFSKNHVYKLTSNNLIKFYKPLGKAIFFDLEDVLEFLKTNPVNNKNTKDQKANSYFIK